MHENTSNLPTASSVIEKHQKDSDQDWKDASIEKRGNTKLRAAVVEKMTAPSTLKDDMMAWNHDNLKYPGGDRACLTTKQYFCWKGINTSAKSHVNNCETY